MSSKVVDLKYQNITFFPGMALTEQLLAFPPTDEGHAHAVKFLYGDVIRYSNKSGWSHWDGTKWVTDESVQNGPWRKKGEREGWESKERHCEKGSRPWAIQVLKRLKRAMRV